MVFKLGLERKADFLGIGFLLYMLYREVTFYFYPYKKTLVRYHRSPKAYALITAASGGIGYGYAEELASHGFNLILLANKKEKLENAANKIRTQWPGLDIRTISYNGVSGDYEGLEKLLAPMMELPITIVINNLGLVTHDPPYATVEEYTIKEVAEMFHGNMGVMTHMTRFMMPVMIKNQPSVFLHMSSGAHAGSPWLEIYSGVKGYVNSFATALSRTAKLEGWKVDSISIVAGEVVSEGNSNPVIPSPTSREYAKVVLDRVEMAVDRGLSVVSPFWKHAIGEMLLSKLPERVVRMMLGYIMKKKKEDLAKHI